MPESIEDREALRLGTDEIVVAIQAAGVAMDAVVVVGHPR